MTKQIILSGNCYWCLEALFQKLKGVELVESGMYQIEDYDFSFGKGDKVEAIRLTYNEKLSLDNLLNVFFLAHNPSLNVWNKQEAFYPACRSGIYFEDDADKEFIMQKIETIKPQFGGVAHTQVGKILSDCFFLADVKNKNYYINNPRDGYCTSIIEPRMTKLKAQYAQLLN